MMKLTDALAQSDAIADAFAHCTSIRPEAEEANSFGRIMMHLVEVLMWDKLLAAVAKVFHERDPEFDTSAFIKRAHEKPAQGA